MRLPLILGVTLLACSLHAQTVAESKKPAEASAPAVEPLLVDGVLKSDRAITDYVRRWAKYLLEQGRASDAKPLESGLRRRGEQDVDLLEPSDTPLSPEELFERCAPAVLILCSGYGSDAPMFTSSGFVIRADGLALTNYHVMKGKGEDHVAATLSGRVLRVKEVLAGSKADDLALIRLDGDGLDALPLARSAPVGADLVDIGHPNTAFFTLTSGRLARHVRERSGNRVMVTTAFAKGSSGSPILDRYGAAVGMVAMTRSVAYNNMPLREKGGVLKKARTWGRRGLNLSRNHQMTLRYAVPCESMRTFLTPSSVGQARGAGGKSWLVSALTSLAGTGTPEVEPLRSDGVMKADGDVADYIDRWAKHLLKQERAADAKPLSSGLNRILEREVDLIEPSQTPLRPEELYERCAPGVLIISGSYGPKSRAGHAGGFVVSADGLALTNYHVLKGKGDEVVATTLDGRVVRVKEILAADEADDVALIQLDGDGFTPLPIAKSVPVGADLVAISHPNRAFYTFTEGRLARHTRVKGRHRSMVTTEFAMGSSGSPILDRFGAVAGMVELTRSIAYNTMPVHEKDGVLKTGRGEGGQDLYLSWNHQMTLRYTIPCQSLRAFLTLQPLGAAQSVDVTKTGLDWALYEGKWNRLPDFTALEPAGRGTCELPADDVHRGRADEYALVFSGFIVLPRDGAWRFGTTSDDGSRLYIDGQLVVDNDGWHAAVSRSGARRLAAGLHAIRIEFFDYGGPQELKVQFSGPDQPWADIPTSAFRRL